MAEALLQRTLAFGQSASSQLLILDGELEFCYEVACLQIGQVTSQVRVRAESTSAGRRQTVASFYIEGSGAQRDTIAQPPARLRIICEVLQGACQLTITQVEREMPQAPPNLEMVPGSVLYVSPETGLIETLHPPPPGHYLGTNTIGEFGYHALPAASGPTGSLFSWNEVPGGVVDGVNKAFTLEHAPEPSQALLLYRNGLLLKQSLDYLLSSKNIEFERAPTVGSSVLASYPYI